MSEALVWRRADGTMVLDWPEDVRTLPVTRELISRMVDDLNERAALRSALIGFLVLDSEKFEKTSDLTDAWRIACNVAQAVLGVTSP